MSKSLGNVVNPMEIIEGGNNKKKQPAYGVDVLRLWVASVDYAGDVCIGDGIMKQTFDSYRKLRNTARYLIGNLADFNPEEHTVPYEDLPSLDKYMLGRLSSMLKAVHEAYDEYQFYKATQELLKFANNDMSSFYLDVAKDRLYTSAKDDFRRRSCQTVLEQCLIGLAKSVAPILPHMAEDIWQNLPFSVDSKSVFEGGLPTSLDKYDDFDVDQWSKIRDLRDDINKQLEVARNDKLVGASLDAAVYIQTEDDVLVDILTKLKSDESISHPPKKNNGVDDLRTVLMISQVHLVSSKEEIKEACGEYVSEGSASGSTIGVAKASGKKCGRCWFYDSRVGTLGHKHDDLCERCVDAVNKWEETSGNIVEKKAAVEPVA
jgi:isoleucyl-tRNA synthetase